MDEEDDCDDLEWDKPQEFVDELHVPENKFRDRQSTVKHCISKASHPRVILHIDIDCFYAQVEMIRNPALRTKPVGIQQKYIVVTCNYPAREYGVTKLMLIKDAKEKCPSLVLVNGEDLTHYRHMSYKISEYLQQYCPKVERLGFDENFLDITDLVTDRLANQSGESETEVKGHVYGEEPSVLDSCGCGCHERLRAGSHIAAEIREGLFRELGITCCGGIASNKLLSKLVAGSHKPNQQTTLFPETTGSLMGSLKSVRNIPGIGHASSKQLQELGVVSVRDLQDAELQLLKKMFGEVAATHMQQLAHGIDESPVLAYSLPQTLSDEDSFKKCSSVNEVERKIKELINSLLKRLLEDGRTPTTLRLTVRKLSAAGKYLSRESRQCPIPSAVFSQFSHERIPQTIGQLRVLAMALFNKLVNTKQPFHLTLINVAFAKMEEKSKNMISNFFSPRPTVSKDRKDLLDVVSSESMESETCSLANPTENVSSKSMDRDTCNLAGLKDIDVSKSIEHETSSINLLSKDVISEAEKAQPNIKRDTVNINTKQVNDTVRDSGKRNSLTKWLSSGKNDLQGSDKAVVNRPDSQTNVMDIIVKSDKSAEDHESLVTDKNSEHFTESINNERNKILVQKRKTFATEVQVKPDTASEVDSTPKRQRLMENFDDLIPEHIDKAVFYQLPPAIQQEILSSSKIKTSVSERSTELSAAQTMNDTANMEMFTSKDRNYLDKSPTGDGGMRQNKVSDITQNSQTSISTNGTPKTIKSPNAGFFKSKAMKKSGIKTDTRLSGNKDSLGNYTETRHTESTKATGTSRCDLSEQQISGCDKPYTSTSDSEHMIKPEVLIPPNIDEETFLSLPSDIQQELISEWKMKELTEKKTSQTPKLITKTPTEKKAPQMPKLQAKGPNEKNTLQTPNNKPVHFKMPEKSPHNNIMSYFPKANK